MPDQNQRPGLIADWKEIRFINILLGESVQRGLEPSGWAEINALAVTRLSSTPLRSGGRCLPQLRRLVGLSAGFMPNYS